MQSWWKGFFCWFMPSYYFWRWFSCILGVKGGSKGGNIWSFLLGIYLLSEGEPFCLLLRFICSSCFCVYVTAFFCHHSGLCGWDAHPQGCSCGQSGMYQCSLDSGSESWVSPVISPISSFFFLCNIQHLSYTFTRDHHQIQIGVMINVSGR